MSVNDTDLGRRVRCPSCHKTFRSQNEANESQTTVENITTFLCKGCGKEFAISSEMSGKVVACPFCSLHMRIPANISIEFSSEAGSQQHQPSDARFKLTDDRPHDDLRDGIQPSDVEREVAPSKPSVDSTNVATPVEPRVEIQTPDSKSKKPASDLQSIDQVSDPPAADQTNINDADDGLLPPEYLMQFDQPDEGFNSGDAQEQHSFVVNTGVTRIESAGEVVTVRSLSREEKRRRKQIRVAVVLGCSVVVLIVVFYLLNPAGG